MLSGSGAALRDRLAQFSLELNAEKTRLIEFGRVAAERRAARGLGRPETFRFLGFTHVCAKTRKGRYKLKRITDSKRPQAKLRALKGELMRRRHQPIPEQGSWLASVLRGHAQYYGVPDNSRHCTPSATTSSTTGTGRYGVHQRDRLTWKRMRYLRNRWLPIPKIVHPWPDARFDARTQGEPGALAVHAGICAGCGSSPPTAKTRPYRDQARRAWPRSTRGQRQLQLPHRPSRLAA